MSRTEHSKTHYGPEGACYAPYAPSRAEEVAEYLYLLMPAQELLEAYMDIEDINLPLGTILNRCYLNLRREVISWGEERQQEEWAKIQSEIESKGE